MVKTFPSVVLACYCDCSFCFCFCFAFFFVFWLLLYYYECRQFDECSEQALFMVCGLLCGRIVEQQQRRQMFVGKRAKARAQTSWMTKKIIQTIAIESTCGVCVIFLASWMFEINWTKISSLFCLKRLFAIWINFGIASNCVYICWWDLYMHTVYLHRDRAVVNGV